MGRRSIVYAVLLVFLVSHVSAPTWAEPDNPDKYLNAVREFADNVYCHICYLVPRGGIA
jgi:hypothetical protein